MKKIAIITKTVTVESQDCGEMGLGPKGKKIVIKLFGLPIYRETIVFLNTY